MKEVVIMEAFELTKITDITSLNQEEVKSTIIKNNLINIPSTYLDSALLLSSLMEDNYSNVFDIPFSEYAYQNINLELFVDYIIKNRKLPHTHISYFKKRELYQILLTKESDLFFKSMDLTIYETMNHEDIAKLIIKLNLKEIPSSLLSSQIIFNVLMKENYQNLPFIPFKLELYEKYGLKKAINKMSLDTFSEYIIYQNLTSLPKELYKDSKLLNILIDKNYLKTLNIHFDIEIYEENIKKISQFIEKNHITKMNNELLNNFELFHELLEINYQYLTDIPFNIILYNMYGIDKIINKISLEKFITYLENLGLKSNFSKIESPKIKESIINYLIDTNYPHLLNNITEITAYKNIDLSKLGDYIIKNNITSFQELKNFSKSKEILTYLLTKNYQNTFKLNFDNSLYHEIDESILIEYIKNNNLDFNEFPKGIKNSTKLKALNFYFPKTNLLNLEQPLLYYSRIESTKYFKSFKGLSLRIEQMLNVESVDKVIAHFYQEIKEISKILNLSEEEIKKLFINYQNNPEEYREKINLLIRKFISVAKEIKAIEEQRTLIERIKLEHTITKDGYESLLTKKEKRKLLYLANLKKRLLEPETLSFFSNKLLFLEDFDSLSPYETIEKIINGKYQLKKPDNLDQTIKTKTLRRLKNNYEKTLLKILKDNQNISHLIINYLNNLLSYDDIKKYLTKETLKIILDIKSLTEEATVSIAYHEENIIWNIDYQEATTKDFENLKEYELKLKKLKKLRRTLNKEINEFISLEEISLTKEESIPIKDIPNKYLEISIDSFNSDEFIIILEILSIRNKLKEEILKKTFDKFFLDTGLLTSLLVVSNKEYLRKIKSVAENVEIIYKNFNEIDINITNLDKIIKKCLLHIYGTEQDCAILSEEIIAKLAYNDSYILEPTDENKKLRVTQSVNYHILSSKYIESTIPYSSVKLDNLYAKRYKNNDPLILTSGIDTDSCFKISGIDNDFILYTMFNKNGVVYKITDEKGNIIGKISGFRNGNIVYFNELRTIYDNQAESITKENIEIIENIKKIVKKISETLIKDTAEDEYPIEHVVILNAYAYQEDNELKQISDSLISFKPMDTTHENWYNFTNNNRLTLKDGNKNYFKTDYASQGIKTLLLASKEGCTLDKKTDIKKYDPAPIYERPREKVIYKTKEQLPSMIKQINQIYAKYCYYYQIDYSKIESLENIETLILGEDWYLTIDKFGHIESIIIPLDKRAEYELNEAKETLSLSKKVKIRQKTNLEFN